MSKPKQAAKANKGEDVMDLQKERESFEKLPDINAILHNSEFGFNEGINQYYHPNHTEHRLSYAFLMGAWAAWQAAKAVPDGFVLVSQKELLELVIAINAVDLSTHTEGKPNEVREMWQQVAIKLGALCSTGASQ